ncbi:chondroitinase B family protein [Hydrogenophaga sp. RAC07]|uniref:chondroitinase-B domain-containing protein n=1 Tax=Hydrogenophaga sp. RAC07 TaxID=1842537 RepID=UPI00083E4D6A|nr:chondroitinase-B domain-containing protein [Hydrogenophaga sp. RAC07]AOF88102.1 chondroitinase B family protein [Hydrogenophaga sp. RAC07]
MRRLTRWTAWLALCALLLTAAAAALLTLTPTGQNLVAEANSRSPQEIIRYLKRRLEGHNKLEAVLLPPLHAAQRHFEREPPAGPLPTLGKGRQATALKEPIAGISQQIHVDSPQAIRQALLQAKAGTRIVVAPGLYPFSLKMRLGNEGRSDAPIVLSAERPGAVWFQFGQVEGILVDRPYWTFENLDIRGVCKRHDDCEHAFHVVGRAAFTTIRNNRITDFNTHIKVNGYNGDWPDHGMLAHNTLTNTSERATTKPVVPFDLVGANHWRVQDNLVSNFVKRDGNKVSYGLFMKGASEGGRIERNLVICTPNDISRPGARVGISFGGGGTGPAVCRDGTCQAYEHRLGLAANNIVAHCNDTGLDVNQSNQIVLAHNTLINTSGVATRGTLAQARLYGNLYEGVARARDGSRITAEFNETLNHGSAFVNTDGLLLDWRQPPERVLSFKSLQDDFYRQPRAPGSLPGALSQ